MNVRIQCPLRFLAAIYHEDELRMNEYTVKCYLMTATDNPTDQNIALNRIKHFVYNEIEDTIFIDESDEDQCKKLVAAGLNITTMPNEPADQLIGIMLYSKFTAITEGKFIIGEVEISSMLSDGIVYLHGENELPDGVGIPDWWSTSDLVHCNESLIDSEKIVTIHKNSVWRDLELQWDEDDDEDEEELGNTVVFADFKRLDDKN